MAVRYEKPDYENIPILEAARRCGLMIDSRTLRRREVEASCPFCGDHGKGKFHLSMNADKNMYRCNLCGASGNSVSLYARLENVTYKQAAEDLLGGGNLYRLPKQPESKKSPEREPKDLYARHEVYSAMLAHLCLSEKHRGDLKRRGLSDGRIEYNMYRSMPETEDARRMLSGILSDFHDLDGIPGFYMKKGVWTLGGSKGLLIPIRDKDGYIQGLQIRLDDATNPERKYRWLSSRHLKNGTRSRSYIHVTGNKDAKVAYLTEGGLKGDVASFLDDDALFICLAGINALDGLADVIQSLDVNKIFIAADMDRLVNPQVREGIERIRQILRSIKGLTVECLNWNMSFKGVDDYYYIRRALKMNGKEKEMIVQKNEITEYLLALWKEEYPDQDSGFIKSCQWEELTVPLSALKCKEPANPEKAWRYLKMLRGGNGKFPPLVCVNGIVIDGMHRYDAYSKAGYAYVRIYQNMPLALPMAA